MESYEATKDDVSWLDAVDLLTTDVSSLLNCEGLRGYVFPAPGKDDTVRIYDWVSLRIDPPNSSRMHPRTHTAKLRHTSHSSASNTQRVDALLNSRPGRTSLTCYSHKSPSEWLTY
jgi:hypothetical protein